MNDNWWNEVLREEGWFETQKQEPLYHDVKMEERTGHFCKICGSRTGLHGFSFDTKAW